jgi:hypothetical protein
MQHARGIDDVEGGGPEGRIEQVALDVVHEWRAGACALSLQDVRAFDPGAEIHRAHLEAERRHARGQLAVPTAGIEHEPLPGRQRREIDLLGEDALSLLEGPDPGLVARLPQVPLQREDRAGRGEEGVTPSSVVTATLDHFASGAGQS